CSALVTPDSAETTTSTRASSSATRRAAIAPMVSHRCRRDTDVPPNLSTIQRLEVCIGGNAWVAAREVAHSRRCRRNARAAVAHELVAYAGHFAAPSASETLGPGRRQPPPCPLS